MVVLLCALLLLLLLQPLTRGHMHAQVRGILESLGSVTAFIFQQP
jgi:hypothetical protein